jgi:hypothetical protein
LASFTRLTGLRLAFPMKHIATDRVVLIHRAGGKFLLGLLVP